MFGRRMDDGSHHEVVENNELMDAIRARDIEKVSYLILNSPGINEENYTGETALHLAVESENAQIVELLLGIDGINVDAAQEEGLTPLMYACNKVSSFGIIKLLLESGADINAQDYMKNTALHIAMKRRETEVVAMLLYYNADVSIASEMGPVIQEAPTAAIKELLLPYTDLCDEDVLYCLDFATIKYILDTYQTKAVFAQWLLEDIQTRMRYLFVINKVRPKEMCQFLHELFEDEELWEVMYLRETSATLLEIRPFRSNRSEEESYVADMLRLLLSNCNVLKTRTFKALQDSTEYSPVIIRVLENLDVIIQEESQENFFIPIAATPSWPLLWKMHCKPRIELEEDLIRSAIDGTVRRFYAVGRTSSLVELCRNRIRDIVLVKYARLEPDKPFHYATVLKPLKIPRMMIDVLLLRKPLY